MRSTQIAKDSMFVWVTNSDEYSHTPRPSYWVKGPPKTCELIEKVGVKKSGLVGWYVSVRQASRLACSLSFLSDQFDLLNRV